MRTAHRYFFILLLFSQATAFAQTDIHITGARAGFPVALPRLCDAGGAGDFASQIPERIIKNLDISGLFQILNPNSYVSTPGKCVKPGDVAFSDWTVIGAEGLVQGQVRVDPRDSNVLLVELYLYDIQQRRAVLGKRYESDKSEVERVANRFSNEIMKFFTGEEGVFGSKIVYVSRVGRFKELFIMNVDGSGVKQLTREKGLAISPSWSPSGDRIVYTSYATRRPELYLISPNGGKSQQLTDREGLEVGAEYAPDGTSLLATATSQGLSNIAEFSLGGRLLRNLTNSNAIDVSPSWSPDGTRVAFCSNRGGGPQIYIMERGGEAVGRPKRISYTESNYCTSPSWSPKGDKIAFVCRTRGNQIFVASPQIGQVTQLTFRGNNEDPSWSPDGRFLAFSSSFGSRGIKNIGILSLLSGVMKQITFGKVESAQPVWSPRLD